jgi:hypothetical protein
VFLFALWEGKYAGLLTPEESRIAQPAPEKPTAYELTPALLEQLVAARIKRHLPPGGPVWNLEAVAQAIREENEQKLQRLREYDATRPDIRRPAELLAVLQKVEQYLRATEPDWYSKYDGSFQYDTNFEELYAFLREAKRQHKLISWSY